MSLTSYRAAPPRVKPCNLGPVGTGPHAGGVGIQGAGGPARRGLCSNRFPAWEERRAILSRLFRALRVRRNPLVFGRFSGGDGFCGGRTGTIVSPTGGRAAPN